MTEEWRWLPGFERWLEVSDIGGVRRWYEPMRGRPTPNNPQLMLDEPVIVTPFEYGRGYLGFWSPTLPGAKRAVRFLLHSAVLLTFDGPADGVACHFPDPTGSNCRYDNLRWDHQSENWADYAADKAGPAAIARRLRKLQRRFPHLREQAQLEAVAC